MINLLQPTQKDLYNMCRPSSAKALLVGVGGAILSAFAALAITHFCVHSPHLPSTFNPTHSLDLAGGATILGGTAGSVYYAASARKRRDFKVMTPSKEKQKIPVKIKRAEALFYNGL